jgi:hypothetical protein
MFCGILGDSTASLLYLRVAKRYPVQERLRFFGLPENVIYTQRPILFFSSSALRRAIQVITISSS